MCWGYRNFTRCKVVSCPYKSRVKYAVCNLVRVFRAPLAVFFFASDSQQIGEHLRVVALLDCLINHFAHRVDNTGCGAAYIRSALVLKVQNIGKILLSIPPERGRKKPLGMGVSIGRIMGIFPGGRVEGLKTCLRSGGAFGTGIQVHWNSGSKKTSILTPGVSV